MTIKGILLDIEGTTSSIRFVYDEMFPYVRKSLAAFLAADWEQPEVQACVPLLSDDVGRKLATQDDVSAAVIELMDADVKATGLKKLQGLIWKNGFHSGQLVAHVYEDVAPAIHQWKQSGLDVRIYSSGSVQAQHLFFGHTEAGDLLSLFTGHYDTTIGGKKESSSYEKIATEFGLAASEILFVSDVDAELTAAADAGMQTVLSIRPGNKPMEWEGATIESFSNISLV